MNPIECEQICSETEKAIRWGAGSLSHVPGLIRRIIKEELWRRRKVATGEMIELKSFRELITAKPLRGWGENPDKIEAIIREDIGVLALWKDEMYGGHGGDRKSEKAIKHNNIMLDAAQQGTSRSYTVSRLSKQRPDLFELVKSKKLSANAAAIKAGWRRVKTPFDQLSHWWKKASNTERARFREFIES